MRWSGADKLLMLPGSGAAAATARQVRHHAACTVHCTVHCGLSPAAGPAADGGAIIAMMAATGPPDT
jgi:hypothetical protein